MSFSFNRVLAALFSIIFIGLMAMGFIAYRDSQVFKITTQQIKSTNKILAEAEIIDALDDKKEIAVRGYLLSGASLLLEHSQENERLIFDHISQLRVLVGDNVLQQKRVDSLASYERQKFHVFQTAIFLRNQKDSNGAMQLIVNEEGTALMRSTSEIISNLEIGESGLLQQQQEASEDGISNLDNFFLFLVSVATLLLIISFCLILRNLTERKKKEAEIVALNESLEEKVKERTMQLEITNKDLESFSYSVSHDLRAPLRVIIGFGKMVLKKCADKLDTEGKENLEIIVSNAKQMSDLIDDLLNFSRLGGLPLTVNPVNMKEMVTLITDEVKTASKSTKADIRIHDMEAANCDPALIKQVWVNLISNAVKYSNKKEKPVIDIGSSGHNGSLTYYIKDNGAGFDMKHADKLFGVFQRLHKTTEYEGTGVGLSLVHRIITRHGGKIWAEAKVNEGAAFYFTLPA